MNRILWPLGILLLVGTLVGAGWALNHATPHPADDDRAKHAPLPEVFCLGWVDVPDGVADLSPRQPGEVAEIAATRVNDKEGERERIFKKGEILLRLRSETAQNQLGKAKVALAAAEADLEKAEQLAPELKEKMTMQQAVIDAAREKKVRLDSDLEGKRKALLDDMGSLKPTILKAMEAAAAQADAEIRVQQGQLNLLKLVKPDLEVRRAKADRDAKKLDVKIAEDYLKDFQIEAPFDGIVLRLHTRVGEPFLPNPKVPAIEFCPNVARIVRAEVVQEWGDQVHIGQEVVIQDDTYQGPKWPGRVKSVSPWYAQKRIRIVEPFMMNDVRTIECVVEFTGPAPVRIGQRMRVMIKV